MIKRFINRHFTEQGKLYSALKAAGIVGVTTCLLRWAVPIRSFPSVDDYAYLPVIFTRLDTSLFSRDVFVQELNFHLPAWTILVWLFRHTIGLPLGFWLMILLLALATVGAVYALLRSIGVNPTLLPFVVLLGLISRFTGIGRGLYGGAFGDSFHAQWLAVCLLLWVYVALLREKVYLTGALLGLTFLAHPIVGIHGAVVLSVVVLACQTPRIQRLFAIGCTAILFSSPLLVMIGLRIPKAINSGSWSTADIIEKGYLFRTPHEFDLSLLALPVTFFMILLVILGIAGFFISLHSGTHRIHLPLGLLFAGHLFLIIAAILFHSTWTPEGWRVSSLVPYALHLTRTSPVVVLLAAVMASAGMDTIDRTKMRSSLDLKLLNSVFLTVLILGTILVFIEWNLPKIVLFASFLVIYKLFQYLDLKPVVLVAIALVVFSAVTLPLASWPERLQTRVTPEEEYLYKWIRDKSSSTALFIIPPGFEEFRFHTQRSVYVDFKLFPASAPELIPVWRTRLEEIAIPDHIALDLKGWEAVPQWDRSYYQYNTPDRIVDLLSNTQADFFIRDFSAESIPPYLEEEWQLDPRLYISYSNARFVVLALKEYE